MLVDETRYVRLYVARRGAPPDVVARARNEMSPAVIVASSITPRVAMPRYEASARQNATRRHSDEYARSYAANSDHASRDGVYIAKISRLLYMEI